MFPQPDLEARSPDTKNSALSMSPFDSLLDQGTHVSELKLQLVCANKLVPGPGP